MKSRTRKQMPALDEGLGERLKMTEWRKHYVSSVTAEEEAWPQREPGSNLGRIFVLLLLLHVFIIGAVVLYNIISPKAPLVARTDPKPTSTTGTMSVASMVNTDTTATSAPAEPTPPKTNNTVVKASASTPTPEPVKPKSAPVAVPKPADDGILTYEVKSGDNVPAIAATLGVNPEDLVTMNDLANSNLYPGRKLEYRKPSSGSAPVVASASPAPVLKPQPASQSASHNLVVTPAPAASTTPKQTKPVVLKVDKDKQNANNIPTAARIDDSASDRSADSVPHAVPVKSLPKDVEDQLPAAKPKKNSSADSLPAAKPKSETKHKDKDKSDEPKSKKSSKTDRDRDENVTKSKSEKSSKDSPHKRTHIVGPHETIYSISRKFGVSVSALEKANNIKDPTHIKDGSKITIPSKANAE
jgi:LysM repeat protein